MTSVFINYRRDDSRAATGRIDDWLREKFGRKAVYRDVDNIPAGADFVQHLEQAVANCSVLLAIIGPSWMDAEYFADDDFVRIEIEAALKLGVPIIPVLVDDAAMPAPAQLPPSMAGLVRRNGQHVSTGHDFPHHMKELIASVREALRAAARKRRRLLLEKLRANIGLAILTSALVLIAISASSVAYDRFLRTHPVLRTGSVVLIDVNGDRKSDVLTAERLANGKYQWKFSSGGVASFENLAQGPALDNVRFGDFDGDHITDVFAIDPDESGERAKWVFSRRATGPFETLGYGPRVKLEELGFGDFDGDGRTDVFVAHPNKYPEKMRDAQWVYYSKGAEPAQNLGRGPSREYLGFGDFDHDGRTDVFAACPAGDGADWILFPANGQPARQIQHGPTIENLRFGDFNGDGYTDVFAAYIPDVAGGMSWFVSYGGAASFTKLGNGPPLANLRFGDFNADRSTDVFSAIPFYDRTFKWMYSSGAKTTFIELRSGPDLVDLVVDQ